MSQRGKLVVALMLLAAGALALVSLWYHHQTTRRTIALWGAESAALIGGTAFERDLRATVLRLDPVGDASSEGTPLQTVSVGEERYAIALEKDVTQVSGLGNVRRVLVEDRSYVWDAHEQPVGRAGSAAPPAWRYALRFQADGASATVIFSANFRRAAPAGSNVQARLKPAAAKAVEGFLLGQLPPEEPAKR